MNPARFVPHVTAMSFVALAAALASCGTPCDRVAEPIDGMVAGYEPSGPGGFDAELSGRLVVVDDCTYLDDVNGQRWLPVFPGEPAWSDGRLVAGGQTYPASKSVTIRGGEGSLSATDAIPESCDRATPVWRVSSSS